MAYFTIATKGIFISSRNIANLINQTGYIAVLAVGMTLVIIISHIDLSVGYLSDFWCGCCTAWKHGTFLLLPVFFGCVIRSSCWIIFRFFWSDR